MIPEIQEEVQKMVRKIIHIDEEKCNGCGLCARACHEGAIDIIDGKAKLMREHFCDGFGDCLPNCPTGAITFEEREAPEYDAAAVKKAQEAKKKELINLQVKVRKRKRRIVVKFIYLIHLDKKLISYSIYI